MQLNDKLSVEINNFFEVLTQQELYTTKYFPVYIEA